MELQKRILTSIGFLLFFILLYSADNLFLTWFCFGGVFLVALSEAKDLFQIQANTNHIYIAGTIFWVTLLFYTMFTSYSGVNMVILAVVIYLTFCLYKNQTNFTELKLFLYPSISFVYMFELYHSHGMYMFIWLVLIVAIADSGAYFVGKRFGKTKFNEISPNKTIEGVAGALLLGTILGTLLSPTKVIWYDALVIASLSTLFSVYGDLFESYLKRQAGIKDSGTILPGHGGILDRIDGHMFAVIIMSIMLGILGY